MRIDVLIVGHYSLFSKISFAILNSNSVSIINPVSMGISQGIIFCIMDFPFLRIDFKGLVNCLSVPPTNCLSARNKSVTIM